MAKRLQTYPSEHITVTFDPNLCVHSAKCLAALPAVFDAGRRKWIDVKAASPEAIAAAVDRCPSGALRYRLPGQAEPAPAPPREVTVITLGTDGPLMIEGPVRIETAAGEVVRETNRVALCRCGGTANQPFCDASHLRVGFKSAR
jgi:uncharacterized Fe-S cluster protein YjdI